MGFPVLRWFKREEFGEGADKMNAAFLLWLDLVRDRAGVSFLITSSWRIDTGLHGKGRAVDVRSKTWNAYDKWRVAEAIFWYANAAPGHVEFEMVYSKTDQHWHIGVDDRQGKTHEFIEADE